MVSDAIDRRRLIELYERRLAADPGSRAFLPLAELYRAEGRHFDARRVLETGLVRHPDFVSAMVALAQVNMDLAEEAQGLALFERVVGRDPDNLVALRGLAALAENRADWPGTCRYLERVVRLDAADVESAARYEAARRRVMDGPEDSTTASAPVAAAVVPQPPLPQAMANPIGGVVTLTLADLYLRQGYIERARVLLDRMAAAEPNRQDVQERLERLARTEAAGPAAGVFARRRTASERHDERNHFENWLEKAGEE